MAGSAARESLWAKRPDYPLAVDPAEGVHRAWYRGTLVAESANALVVRENVYPPVLYFPREDIVGEHFERTEHQTFCPFKGEAAYFTLRAGGDVAENAAWTYETPFEQVARLRDHVAFYADRVGVE